MNKENSINEKNVLLTFRIQEPVEKTLDRLSVLFQDPHLNQVFYVMDESDHEMTPW